MQNNSKYSTKIKLRNLQGGGEWLRKGASGRGCKFSQTEHYLLFALMLNVRKVLKRFKKKIHDNKIIYTKASSIPLL